MILFILAVAGSTLILTQSAICKSLREWLWAKSTVHGTIALTMAVAVPPGNTEHRQAHALLHYVFTVLAKLASCPMCSGFWLGIAWSLALEWPGLTPRAIAPLLAHGAAGSIVSAVGVALWLTLIEAQNVGAMWRYLNQPEGEDP